jgi:hypothetical protein
MLTETSDIEKLYRCVHSYLELGDRRGRRSRYKPRPTTLVLVGDSEDARTAKFSFAGYVYQNWPCKKQVTLKDGDRTQTLFWTSTQTVNGTFAYSFFWNGQPAYIFPRNELTEDLWNRHREREILLKWIRAAELQDRTAMAELIVEQTQSGYRAFVYSIPQFTCGVKTGSTLRRLPWPDLQRIEIEIRKLSLPALRNLNSLISVGRSEAKISVDWADDKPVVRNESHQAA